MFKGSGLFVSAQYIYTSMAVFVLLMHDVYYYFQL
jgi:hypothetical protein